MLQTKSAAVPASPYPDARVAVPLKALIAEVGLRSGEFPVCLANHLPMVLEAMARLGASPARLEEYAEHYIRVHSVPFQPPSVEPVDGTSWISALGDRRREADLRQFFEIAVGRIGGLAAVRKYLPVLGPGVAASATHGLMRLAYALMRADDSEIAAALGYWAATYLAYDGLPADRARIITDPLAHLVAMRDEPGFHGVEAPTHLLWKWIEAMGRLPAFQERLGRMVASPDFLDRIRPAALSLYAGTMSFEALHAVTGCHWLRLVSPHIDEPQHLAMDFWEVVLALYIKIDMPLPPTDDVMDVWRQLPLPDHQEIAAAAVASDDEHDHSLVFSALEEYSYTGERLYKVVAARRVGLIE